MGELPEDIVAATRRFQQGDVLTDIPLVEVADLRRPLGPAAANTAKAWGEAGRELGVAPVSVSTPYVCVISQTCDVISPADSRLTIKVAPVLPHKDPMEVESETRREKRRRRIEQCKAGKNIQLVHLDVPHADFPVGGFVDLQSVTTVEKTLLLEKEPLRPLTSPTDRRNFAFRAAHIYDRPPIPPPFDDYVVRPLRSFLDRLRSDDPEKFALLEGDLEDEWLWLDHEDSPKIGQLYFLGKQTPSDETQGLLDDWWEEIQESLPGGCALNANKYTTLVEVSLAEGKAMSLLTYWYLSDDSAEA